MPHHHPRLRGKTDRHIGARCGGSFEKPRIIEREPIGAGKQPQRRGRIRRAAANPRRNRQSLHEMKGAKPQAFDTGGEIARRLDDEIAVEIAGSRSSRPGNRSRSSSPGARDSVSPPREKATRLSSW